MFLAFYYYFKSASSTEQYPPMTAVRRTSLRWTQLYAHYSLQVSVYRAAIAEIRRATAVPVTAFLRCQKVNIACADSSLRFPDYDKPLKLKE